MFDWFLGIVESIGNWGYLIIFLVTFLESSAFTGMLVPGESLVVIAGFLSLSGYLNIANCMIVAGLGTILGDSIGYILGRVLGRGYFERHGRLLFLKAKHIERVEKYFKQHGGKTVFFGKFIGFLRSFGPFTAGMSRMPYRIFLMYNLTSCIIWAIGFSLLGYFFGWSWHAIEKWSGRAGVFIFFLLLIIVGFSRLYSVFVKKQAEFWSWFYKSYHRIVSSPRIQKFIANHSGFVTFVKDRLSPESYLGLHLTAGLAVSAVCIWLFGVLTEDVVNNEKIILFDNWVLNNVLYFRTEVVTKIMIVITQLGEWTTILLISLPMTIYMLIKRRIGVAIGYVTAVAGGGGLDVLLKHAIRRERPVIDINLIQVGGFSFPSGHAMLSAVFFGMIAYFLIRYFRSWRTHLFIVISTTFMIFLIGFTRLYLQVHYLSDIIAGYIAGLFWLIICITGLEIYRKRRESKSK
jgi:membrane protein DedA with SNARE-associated domain/membrane-associated phospholipid phosphatase